MLTECLAIAGSIVTGTTSTYVSLNIFTAFDKVEFEMSYPVLHTLDGLSECMSEWLFLAKTNFHGMELNLPWYFGLFCLNYSFGGIASLITKPKWARNSYFPYVTFSLFLLFLQGPLSFMADYMNMTNESVWHALDKASAVPLTILELSKIYVMRPYTRPNVWTSYVFSLTFSMSSFLMSQLSQKNLDRDGFVFWHNLWHLHPLAVTCIMFYDFFVLGEYDSSVALKDQEKKSTKPQLLSTVVMNDPMYHAKKNSRGTKTRKES
uniref:Uncharacterized protein n=1 Tax=Ditylum brightwellii TaxID=49249 RepID=A0A6S9JQJ6_9STRA|mmetsp:Transcript_7039/g.9358  ORF Transcript_7039/g.9358 Transcript_7039/m.9358 type:complete len:264 (+) Transcript_7039:22-813(+)